MFENKMAVQVFDPIKEKTTNQRISNSSEKDDKPGVMDEYSGTRREDI